MAKYYISSGNVANNITVTNGARMYISNGGIANNTTVDYYGSMYISSGGEANNTTLGSKGILFVYSGGVANGTTINSSGVMHISSTGVVSGTTVNSGGRMIINMGATATDICVAAGGKLTITIAPDTYIQGTSAGSAFEVKNAQITGHTVNNGSMNIRSGGMANSTTVNSSGVIWLDPAGVANNTTLNCGGSMYISSGGTANNTQVNSGCSMTVNSYSVANSTTVNSGGIMIIYSRGRADTAAVNSGGTMYISNGATAVGIVENGGYVSAGYNANVTFASNIVSGLNLSGDMTVHRNTVAHNTTVNSGGRIIIYNGGVANSTAVRNCGSMYISSGGAHRGSLQIVSGAVVSAYSGSVIDFTLSNRTTADPALINNLALISGAPNYTITVSNKQIAGNYKLAEGASGFNNSVSIYADGVALGNVSVGNTFTAGDKTVYELQNNAGSLSLTVKSAEIARNSKNFAYCGNLDGSISESTKTAVRDGSFKRFYGGNYVEKNREFVDITGSVDLTVTNGTFSSVVAAGDHVVDGIVTRTGAISTTINGGTFSNNVAGGMCLDIATGNSGMVMAATGDINLTIAGGTFAKRIFGGNISSKASNSGKMEVIGNINLVLDATEANITIGENIAAGNSGYGWVRGDVTVTLKKSANFNLTMNGMLSGAGEGAVYTVTSDGKRTPTSYVEGERTLVLDGYNGNFDGTIFMFETLEVKNSTAINFTNAKLYTGDISSWDLEYGSTVTGLQRNTFDGDTLNLDLTGWDGSSDWEVLAGTAETFTDLSEAAKVTLGTQTASWDGSAWVSTDYKLSVDEQENKLVLAAIA